MRFLMILPLAGLMVLAGCGKPQPKFDELHPVTGVVLSGDRPVSRGAVQFAPDPDRPEFLVNSEVGADGTFKLSTVRTTDSSGERRAGAPAGTYKVTYSPAMADQTSGYTAPVTLPTAVTVEAKSNDLKLTLPKK